MEDSSNKETPIHSMEPAESPSEDISMKKLTGILVGFVVVGFLVGFVVSLIVPRTTGSSKTASGTFNKVSKKQVGIADKKTFKDSAEGVLREGGFEGEGSYHLERPGGDSQNVYLTSSAVDLAPYVGKKVKVWGETFAAEKAGWLMDVGLIEPVQ